MHAPRRGPLGDCDSCEGPPRPDQSPRHRCPCPVPPARPFYELSDTRPMYDWSPRVLRGASAPALRSVWLIHLSCDTQCHDGQVLVVHSKKCSLPHKTIRQSESHNLERPSLKCFLKVTAFISGHGVGCFAQSSMAHNRTQKPRTLSARNSDKKENRAGGLTGHHAHEAAN